VRRVNGRSGELRVGCSGWSYRDWRGVVYPRDVPASRWFAAYAELFDTVELNNTFYRLPPEQTVERWREQAPAGFVYAVKVGAFGTHRKKLGDPTGWLDRHLDRVRRLGASTGPQLVQLPPRWRRNVPRLDEFLDAAPDDLRWAVEVRDRSWLHDDVFDVLARHGAALCVHDLVRAHPWELTADWAYVRFHGPDPDRRYHGRYGGRRLWRPAERIGEWCDAGRDVFAYFNNDFHGHAVVDARWLRDRVVCAARATSTWSAPD
jgi:uncharacterized protein YecE (DUF72 family)